MEKLFNRIAYHTPTGISGIILNLLLFPIYLLSLIYNLIIRLRLKLYRISLLKSREAGVEIISIGNLTVGGTGKTPTVEAVARLLTNKGEKVAVVSRGYKGSSDAAVNIVSDAEKILLGPDMAGDEPFMLAEKLKGVPVIIGRKRYEAGRLAKERFGVGIAILDDGFQHLRLKRDIDIVVVDGKRGIGNGHLFPRGPLREPLSGIRRADIIILNGSSGIDPDWRKKLSDIHPSASMFEATYKATFLRSLWSGGRSSLDIISGTRVLLLSAIAAPGSFRTLIESLGGSVIETVCFPDHYAYAQRDLDQAASAALEKKAGVIVTTEKDAVKLKQLKAPSGIEVYALEIHLDLLGREKELAQLLVKHN